MNPKNIGNDGNGSAGFHAGALFAAGLVQPATLGLPTHSAGGHQPGRGFGALQNRQNQNTIRDPNQGAESSTRGAEPITACGTRTTPRGGTRPNAHSDDLHFTFQKRNSVAGILEHLRNVRNRDEDLFSCFSSDSRPKILTP